MCIVAGIFWLGGTNARAFLGNDMLKPGTMEFEDYLAPESEREVFRLISVTSVVVAISYIVTLISSLVFLFTSPFRLKEHGWLVMAVILFYLFVPVEIYTMILDGKMVYKEFFTTADNAVFRQLFIARVKALSGAPVVAILCYYTAIGLAVFQPFRKPPKLDHEA
ncbi:MAG: hypothetical protein WB699_16140 [Bacteroidota bacterium]